MIYKKLYLIGVIMIAAVVVTGCVHSQTQTKTPSSIGETGQEEVMEKNEVTVEIFQQNDSGQSGNATLIDVEGTTKVVLSFDAGVPDDILQPAHIHTGSCTELGGIVYPLSDVSGIGTGPGGSDTTIDESLDEILSQKPLAINVHQSKDEISVYVACGDIQPSTDDAMMDEQKDSDA